MGSFTASIDDLEAPSLYEQLQRLGTNVPLVDRVNLMLGSLKEQPDERRYQEMVFVLNYNFMQYRNAPKPTEMACRKIQDYVEWKHPDLYGFLHNPFEYGYIKSLFPIRLLLFGR